MWTQKPSFRFEIDNFSEKKATISSETFVCGGCEWYLDLYPTEDHAADDKDLSLYLHVANRQLLPTGWKRNINFYFVLLNQSDKELYRSLPGEASKLFCAARPAWGFQKLLPLSKFQETGFLENDRLIIEVYIKIVEAVGLEGEEASEKKKTVIINGFQVFASQVTLLRKILAEHPRIAEDFKPKNQAVKDAYMNVLLKLVKTLHKPPKSLSETTLSEACSQLTELTNVGFKLDWLKFKLEEVSLERKKSDADGSRVQQLEERVKNLELMELGFKLDSLNTKLDELSLERKKSDDADESRSQQLEERVKNLELMELGFKLDSLNTKLDEVSLERKKSCDADKSRARQLEERVKNLELMDLGFKVGRLNTKLDKLSLDRQTSCDSVEARVQEFEERVWDFVLKLDYLYSKLEEISLESKKIDNADGSQVQQLEKSVKNIELMVSHLKVELDKKKDKSSADGFLLVDEVD